NDVGLRECSRPPSRSPASGLQARPRSYGRCRTEGEDRIRRNWIASAGSRPAISASSLSTRSMPAAMPAAVTTFPERTTRPYGLERLERALATERQFAGTAHTNYRRRSQLRAQEREIRMLQRTGVPT